MKLKVCCVIFAFLTLCGCGNSKDVKPVMNNIDFTAEIEFADEYYMCDVSVSDESTNIKVVKPEEISGLTLHFAGTEVSAEYLGIKYTPNAGTMPTGSVAVILNDVINFINKEDITAVSNEDNCSIKDEVGDCEFEFVFSPAGLPLELKIPDKDYTVKFNNVTIK